MARTGLSAQSQRVLSLVARCPDMPTDVVAALMGSRRAVSVHQLLHRLQSLHLVRSQREPASLLLGTKGMVVWAPTTRGIELARANGVRTGEVVPRRAGARRREASHGCCRATGRSPQSFEARHSAATVSRLRPGNRRGHSTVVRHLDDGHALNA
jgi:hypothetical protein